MVDVPVSKAGSRKGVQVRCLSSVPNLGGATVWIMHQMMIQQSHSRWCLVAARNSPPPAALPSPDSVQNYPEKVYTEGSEGLPVSCRYSSVW